MVAIKSYTSLDQSKKLAEILPLESADMHYVLIDTESELYSAGLGEYIGILPHYPCWSLSALLDVLPADYIAHKHYFLEISKMGDNTKPYEVRYFRFREQSDGANFGRIIHISYTADNLVDACVEMIIKLHELKML